MKKTILFSFFLLSATLAFAQGEIGPEGEKLLWFLLIPVVAGLLTFLIRKKKVKKTSKQSPLFRLQKIKVDLEKDRLYYPDNLNLTIVNKGNTDVDLDKPLLIFDNFWLKRKFRIKGSENRSFYPLFLEKNKSHTLQIDLARFYAHDKSLKKFPKAKIKVFDVKGKRLGSKTVYLRKTLVKF